MQKLIGNSIYGNSLKRLIRDLSVFKEVDFITNDEEIHRLQKYSKYRMAYESYRAQGNAPDNLCVIVGHGNGQEQFFLIPRKFGENLSILLNKKLSELSSEERVFLSDTSNESTIDVLEEGVLV